MNDSRCLIPHFTLLILLHCHFSHVTATIDFIPATRTITFPQSESGSIVCTSFDITDDALALEGDEAFNVDFEFAPGSTAQKGTIAQSIVVIEDDDGIILYITPVIS